MKNLTLTASTITDCGILPVTTLQLSIVSRVCFTARPGRQQSQGCCHSSCRKSFTSIQVSFILVIVVIWLIVAAGKRHSWPILKTASPSSSHSILILFLLRHFRVIPFPFIFLFARIYLWLDHGLCYTSLTLASTQVSAFIRFCCFKHLILYKQPMYNSISKYMSTGSVSFRT